MIKIDKIEACIAELRISSPEIVIIVVVDFYVHIGRFSNRLTSHYPSFFRGITESRSSFMYTNPVIMLNINFKFMSNIAHINEHF